MLLGALAGAGASRETLQAVIPALGLVDCELSFHPVTRAGISALQAIVKTPNKETPRHLSTLLEIVSNASLPGSIKEKGLQILRRLGEVEAGIHGTELEHVHLHELGGDDTLIDVLGVLVGLDDLGVERVYVSSLPLGRGFIRSAHGQLPLPAPATLKLLEGLPVHYVEIEKELVTPTGAALVGAIAEDYGGFPPMRLEKVGVGAGGRELPFPNVIRMWVGQTQESLGGLDLETLVVLETNIDDMNPQQYEHVMERLFEAGALDVNLAPLQMKKNRPATLLSVLCRPQTADLALEIILRETTTLGVRRYPVERFSLPRSIEITETSYGPIRVKRAEWGDIRRIVPEYEDCKRAAREHHVPLEQVMARARQAYSNDA